MEQASQHQPASRSSWRWFVLVGGLLVVYILSSGPAVYLRERGVLSKQVVRVVYTPLIGIDDDRFDGYLGWWTEKGRKKP
jgi:hypothetical protein